MPPHPDDPAPTGQPGGTVFLVGTIRVSRFMIGRDT